MTVRTSELLADLSKLLRKYGPAEFERLARNLREENFVERLAELLETSAAVGRRTRKAEPLLDEGAKNLERKLEQIRSADPARFKLLVEARRRLVEGRAMPKISDIADFARQHRLGTIKPRKREQAVTALLHVLARLDEERLGEAVSDLIVEVDRTSGLEAWSDIILQRRPRGQSWMRKVLAFAKEHRGQVSLDPSTIDSRHGEEVAEAILRCLGAGYLTGDNGFTSRPVSGREAVVTLERLARDGAGKFVLTSKGREALASDEAFPL